MNVMKLAHACGINVFVQLGFHPFPSKTMEIPNKNRNLPMKKIIEKVATHAPPSHPRNVVPHPPPLGPMGIPPPGPV